MFSAGLFCEAHVFGNDQEDTKAPFTSYSTTRVMGPKTVDIKKTTQEIVNDVHTTYGLDVLNADNISFDKNISGNLIVRPTKSPKSPAEACNLTTINSTETAFNVVLLCNNVEPVHVN